MSTSTDAQRMEKIVSLCKRRGFIFQSSEIYGGLNGAWDYGPLGVELKRNLKNYWWRVMVHERDDVVGMDGAILTHPAVLKASGHVEGFSDPMIDCRTCKAHLRADQLVEKKGIRQCPNCGGKDLTEARQFNLMFETHVGAAADESSIAYLRPETAQSIFVQFKNILEVSRKKLPFGIAQIGKAFRNEINPRNFTFRSREFEQMEIEFFCHPSESRRWYEYWREVRKSWYTKLGLKSERLRPREQGKEELAHYSVGTTDIEYLFPFSDEPQELEGVAHRGDYDLTQHMKHSGKDLTYFEEELWAKADKSPYGGDKKKEQEAKSKMPYRYLPHVIEPSAGADRFTLAVLCEAYHEEQVEGETRTGMKFHPRLAPNKAAILPPGKR